MPVSVCLVPEGGLLSAVGGPTLPAPHATDTPATTLLASGVAGSAWHTIEAAAAAAVRRSLASNSPLARWWWCSPSRVKTRRITLTPIRDAVGLKPGRSLNVRAVAGRCWGLAHARADHGRQQRLGHPRHCAALRRRPDPGPGELPGVFVLWSSTAGLDLCSPPTVCLTNRVCAQDTGFAAIGMNDWFAVEYDDFSGENNALFCLTVTGHFGQLFRCLCLNSACFVRSHRRQGLGLGASLPVRRRQGWRRALRSELLHQRPATPAPLPLHHPCSPTPHHQRHGTMRASTVGSSDKCRMVCRPAGGR